MMKKLLILFLFLLLFPLTFAFADDAAMASPVSTPVPGAQYRKLEKGMSGHDIYLLKIRMYQLGYLNSDRVNDQYTAGFATKIKELQANNNLEETGIATPELQLLIHSDDCIPAAVLASPTPSPSPSPIPTMPVTNPELPAVDEEGFLSLGSEDEFIHEDPDDGLWYYISDSLRVEIRRYTQTGKTKLQWYETDVKLRNISPESYSAQYKKLTSSSFVSPVDLALENHVVLAISDDTYTWRTFYNRRTGIVIRNGVLIENTPYKNKNIIRFPNLDVMAFLPDGTMAMYDNGETTPEYLLSLGVRNAYSFGPILVKNGREMPAVRYSDLYSTTKEPRCAIGMIEPNHYVILTVVGRTSYSDGCKLSWLAEKMLQLGADDAFNLDGGGSAAIVFMGKILNKQDESSIRKITDIIGFGTSPSVQ